MDGQREPTFGRYVVMERAGEGSLGEVFKARHQELGRVAAIKVLRPEVRGNAAAVAGMVAEATTLARLDHPHIVALYDFVQEPERTWLAEQWVDGAPLDRILDHHRRLTPEQALGVLTGALSGLAHAHDHEVVHRDVAASNVLADMAGTSMLVDFGLASPVAGAPASGQAGVLGTPAYLSPEAARGESVGKQGDVYSAAALTYQLLSGLPVFTGTAWEMVAAHRDRPAPSLDGHGPRMTALLARSLAKDPAQRPPDARAFLAELEQAAEERYGAAWRTRASIAGLVAATAGGGAAVLAGGSTATVVAHGLPPAATATSQVAVTTGRRLAPKLLAAAGATAVVAAGVVVAVVALSSNDDDSSAPSADDTTPSLTAEEIAAQEREEKQQALEASVPDGKYWWHWVNVNTQRNGKDLKADKESGGPWVFDASGCTASRCQGSIDSKNGGAATLTFTWDGRTLDITRKPTVEPGDKEACVDTVTGEVLPIGESAARWTAKYAYPPVPLAPGPDGSLPATFSVTRTARYTWEFFGTCEKGPQDVVAGRSTWNFRSHK